LLQVFESSAGELSPHLFEEFSLPYLKEIAVQIRRRTNPVEKGGPGLIVFARNAHFALESLANDSLYDVISLDWSLDPANVLARIGSSNKAFQGNLDPCELFGDEAYIRKATKTMLEKFGVGSGTRLIGNLGHGMMPSHDPEMLRVYFDTIHRESREMLKQTSS